MLKSLQVALFIVFTLSRSGAQEPGSSSEPSQPDVTADRIAVYYGDKDLKLPELLPPEKPLTPLDKCKGRQEGRVRLSLIVDSMGRPRNVFLDRPIGNQLDQFALLIAESDRFKPAIFHGAPVAVGRTVEMHLQACTERANSDSGQHLITLRLRSQPEQKFEDTRGPQQEATLAQTDAAVEKIGGSMTPPKALLQPEAKYTDRARQERIEGVCVIGLTVDAHGMPQEMHVIKTLEASMDQQAVLAVRNYRFRPAMKNNSPVAVTVTVEVRFRLY